MLVDFDPQSRITLAVISLGTPSRLRDCIRSLELHNSRHDFTVVAVVNPAGPLATDPAWDFPPPVHVVNLTANLGWAGGLHVARSLVTSEYLVWVQEDMQVLDGWLDALVDAADNNPDIAAFGSRMVDDEGKTAGFNGGFAVPPHNVYDWNFSDITKAGASDLVQKVDWITSKGLLTRLSAWDEIGGTNPRLFPLGHVDKEYATHLRAHGLAVAIVPDARLTHLGSQSSPSSFRVFLNEWNESAFNAKWGPIADELARDSDARPVHECTEWMPDAAAARDTVAQVSRACGEAASVMLVAYARWIEAASLLKTKEIHDFYAERSVQDEGREQARVTEQLDELRAVHAAEVREIRGSRSWRAAAPLRFGGDVLRAISGRTAERDEKSP